jgi:hypothetical protein
MKSKSLLSLVFLLVLFASCSKSEDATPATDARDQLVGTFIGTATLTIPNRPEQTGIDTVSISKNSDGSVQFTSPAPQAVSFKGSGVTSASNGVGFNIMSQAVSVQGIPNVTINGTNTVTIGSQKFDCGYFTSQKLLVVGLTANLPDSSGTVSAEWIFSGTKR